MPSRKKLKGYILPFSIFKDQIYNTLQNDEERNELLWWSIYKDSKKGEDHREKSSKKRTICNITFNEEWRGTE